MFRIRPLAPRFALLLTFAAFGVSFSTSAHAGADSAFALQIDGDAGSIDAEALRASLQADLRVPFTAGTKQDLGAVVLTRRGDAVVIVFRRTDGRETKRTIDLPKDRALAADTLALAVGNLVRDEAAEILAELAPPPEAPKPAEPPPAPPPPSDETATRLPSCDDGSAIVFGADLVPYVGTSSVYADHARYTSFNLVLGYSQGLRGFELGVGGNIQRQYMCGVQVAAGGNIVTGPVRGLQLASGNIALGPVFGAQVGAIDIAHGDLTGLQVGTADVVGDALTGLQVGTVDLVAGPVTGAQVGGVNIAFGNVDGLQLGAVNVAGGTVRGTQIGVVNYADEADYPLGLVSVVRHGRTSLEAWGTESGLVIAGVRHGGKVLHNLYGTGYLASDAGWALAVGLGATIPMPARWHLDVDVVEYWLPQAVTSDVQLAQFAPTLGYDLFPALAVTLAPTFNVLITDDKNLSTGPRPPLGSFRLSDGTRRVDAWPGANLGLRVNL